MSLYSTASQIRSWLDGYAAIRQRAGEMRGWIELDTDAPDRRWPRTTSLDVVVIASFVDEAISTIPELRISGSARRWSSCKGDLEREALSTLSETYSGNRAFWACLGDVFARLGQLRHPLPSVSAWVTLLEYIGAVDASPLTSDAPPIWFASATSLEALYRAQLHYLAGLRGFDHEAPADGMAGGVIAVPRTTHAEVRQLAAFWTSMLRLTRVKQANGYVTVAARWRTVLDDLDANARRGPRDSLYPGNHAFWRTLSSVAQHAAAAVSGVTDPELRDALEGQVGLVRNSPPSRDEPPVWFASATSLDKLYLAQRTYLSEQRGFDRLAPEPDMTGTVMPIPRSTVDDVGKLAAFWTRALNTEKSKNANGYDTVRARWEKAISGLAALSSTPDVVYPLNHAFWRAASSLARHSAAAHNYGMTDYELWKAEVGGALDSFSQRVKEIAASVKEVTVAAASAAGDVVNAGARSLAGGLAAPLLIGGGVVAAIWLFRRGSSENTRE